MRYYVTGKVFPERCNVIIGEIEKDIKICSFKFNCDSSQILVIIDNTVLDQYSAFILAKEISLTIITSLGYANGCGYGVEMINICDDNKLSSVYGVGVEEMKSSNVIKDFAESLDIAVQNIFYRFSIRDFTKAMTSEMECPFLCYRAIETIKSNFLTESTSSESDAWESMHKKIGSKASDIMKIKPFADPIRHGNYTEFKETDHVQRVEILKITKDTIDRFKQYLMKVQP
jgi:hypothetical protein